MISQIYFTAFLSFLKMNPEMISPPSLEMSCSYGAADYKTYPSTFRHKSSELHLIAEKMILLVEIFKNDI